jgi:hypothetical protein
VEFGLAVALGKVLMVVGHRENIFHCLPDVHFYADWFAALDALTAGRTQFDQEFAVRERGTVRS